MWISKEFSNLIIWPKSTSFTKQFPRLFELLITSSPSDLLKNSPFELNNFKAFQFPGLWLAVNIIPPSKLCSIINNWVVGVVVRSMS